MRTKQVIVMRKDLGMTAGKMIAQGAHASMGALLSISHDGEDSFSGVRMQMIHKDNAAVRHWLDNSFTKIGVRVDSEEALLELHQKALDEGLICCLITDNGDTMFKGVPTRTCLAIGPGFAEDIDKITGGLKLL